MENNLELLPLTDDYIFKRVFAYKGNESVLKDFLEALLKIEIKRIKITNPEERATEYMGKMISEQLQVGEDYQNLKKSIVIFITNYNFLKRNSYHSVGRMKFDKTLKDEYVNMGYEKEDEIASKYIEIHYIELPKFKKKELSKFTKLDQWMCIFTQNKEIKRAINTLDFLSKDPKERERHNSIVMAEYNRLVSEHNFFDAGVAKGRKDRNEKTVKKKVN